MTQAVPITFKLRARDSWFGLLSALSIVGLWLGGLVLNLSVIPWSEVWVWAPLAVVAQTFLYTGLFITAHDAMHGVVCHRHPRLNRWIGVFAVTGYALFSFKRLKARHWEHHDHAGTPLDPDFHDEAHPGFVRWYLRFLSHYVSLWQIVGMAIVFNILLHGVGIEHWKLLVFWVLPSIASTFQLFYFGTYRTHKKEPGAAFPDAHHARSNDYPAWLSFMTCYHFGYHWEHHEYPHCPWWRLPFVRGQSKSDQGKNEILSADTLS